MTPTDAAIRLLERERRSPHLRATLERDGYPLPPPRITFAEFDAEIRKIIGRRFVIPRDRLLGRGFYL